MFQTRYSSNLWSRGGSFGWIKIGDTAFLVCLVGQKPGRPVPQQSPAQEGINYKVLAGGDAGQEQLREEPTHLPGPRVPAAGGQAAWGGGVRPTLPPLPLSADPPPHIG